MKKLIGLIAVLLLFAMPLAMAAEVDNYFDQPNGGSTDNPLYIGGTMNVSGTATFTSMPTFSAGINVDEDVDIDFNAADEEFNLTTSSGGNTAAVTLYNATTDLEVDQHLLSLDLKDNGDANGIFLRCRDNTAADTVLKIGADGAVTIDASGAGSGTVLSEATLVANDAPFRIDSETQDLQVGDGTNNTVFTDNGAMSQTGSATLSAGQITTTVDKIGVTTNGQTVYAVYVATLMPTGTEYTIPNVTGKAGSFSIDGGSYTVRGTFTSGAAVTLGAGSSEVSTTNDAVSKVNIYDAGTTVVLENQSNAAILFIGKVLYIN